MRIGIIGKGAIGQFVFQTLKDRGIGPHVLLTRSNQMASAGFNDVAQVTSVADLPEDITLMVDCAGHAGLAQHGAAILDRGINLVTVSLGALADKDLADRLEKAAHVGGARLHLASGAIGGLDSLRAARIGGLNEVTYIGRKPPLSWKGSPAEEALDLESLTIAMDHFSGTARDAAIAYPKNANVAAAVALAGIGFDATQVRLIADPLVGANIHEIHASGAFGNLSFRVEGKALPNSSRSSALAAMSAVSAIEREIESITI